MTIDAYDLVNKVQNNDNRYTRYYTKLLRVADDDVGEFQEKFEDFRKIVRRLNNYSSNDTTDDKLKDYLSDFADTYNSMKEKREDITDSSLKKQLDKLDTLIDDNEKSLKKLGLKKNDDGELEFDEDTFDDDADQKTINKLFTGTDSFIDQARKLMRKIDYSANDAHIVSTVQNLSDTVTYSEEDLLKAKQYILMYQSNSTLNWLYNNSKDNYISNSSVAASIDEVLTILISNLDVSNKNDSYERLFDGNVVDNLKNIGITYNSNDKSVKYDDIPSTIQEDTYNYSYDKLFNNNEDSFYSKLSKYCLDEYGTVMKLDDIKVSAIINESV
jgi:hypothetical protein